ncbi:hypothetical protein BDK88_3988 [Natrinema hispanicum]|uniref:Uncharacterized protein n=1 Tax=Natrinema hispanicum TaxID=392421 RepID=A0A482Y760_9EURY|nr:hypothetical protein BDK88_3988 [Natrinema hispanicum]
MTAQCGDAEWVNTMTGCLTLSEFATNQATDSRPASQPSTDETVTMIADERVATYPIEDQLADLTDAIREAVQSGIDSPGSSRVSVSISLSGRSASMLALVSISSQPKGGATSQHSAQEASDELMTSRSASGASARVRSSRRVQFASGVTTSNCVSTIETGAVLGRGQTSAVVMANSWTLRILSRGCSSRSIITRRGSLIRTAIDGGTTFVVFAIASCTCSHERASRL